MKKHKKKVALVTGGSGFIGSHLIRRLCGRGWDVFATSRVDKDSLHGESWIRADLANTDDCRAVFDRIDPDVVYHLAGAVGADQDISLVEVNFDSHLRSTLNILFALAEQTACRLVLPASCLEPTGLIQEAMPTSPYAAAKCAATLYSNMFGRLYGVPVVTTRIFVAYGPGQKATKLLPYVIRSIKDGVTPVLASGKWKADWIYIDDVIDAMELCATSNGIVGRTLDIGGGELTSAKVVIDQLVANISTDITPQYGGIPDRDDQLEQAADITLARALLGWSPTVTLREGLRRTVDWYLSHG